MKDVIKWAIAGFTIAVVAVIVFVKAGTTGKSGGEQSAEIVKASFGGLGTLASSLEGNAAA